MAIDIFRKVSILIKLILILGKSQLILCRYYLYKRGKGAGLTIGRTMVQLNQHPRAQKRIDALSEEEKIQKLGLFLEIEPFLHKCLNINHDINNPLTGILGYGEFMLEEADTMPPEFVQQLKMVMECAERIRCIVDDLTEAKSAVCGHVDFKALAEQYGSSSCSSD